MVETGRKDADTMVSDFILVFLLLYFFHFLFLRPDISQQQPLTQDGLARLLFLPLGRSGRSGWMVEKDAASLDVLKVCCS